MQETEDKSNEQDDEEDNLDYTDLQRYLKITMFLLLFFRLIKDFDVHEIVLTDYSCYTILAE
jgi:hypothetical protein